MKNIPFLVSTFIFLFLYNITQGQATSNDYMRAAIEATNKKQYEKAIQLCDAAIALNSTGAAAYFHRGYNRMLLKEYEAAIVDLTVCLDLSPNNLGAYLYRGLSNQKAGNSLAASRDYNNARKIDTLETMVFLAGYLL